MGYPPPAIPPTRNPARAVPSRTKPQPRESAVTRNSASSNATAKTPPNARTPTAKTANSSFNAPPRTANAAPLKAPNSAPVRTAASTANAVPKTGTSASSKACVRTVNPVKKTNSYAAAGRASSPVSRRVPSEPILSAEEVSAIKARGATAAEQFGDLRRSKEELKEKIRKFCLSTTESAQDCDLKLDEFRAVGEELRIARPQWEKLVEDERIRRDENKLREVESVLEVKTSMENAAALDKSIHQRRVHIAKEIERAAEIRRDAEEENAMAVNLLAQIEKQGEKCEEYDTVCKQQDKWRGEQVLRQMQYFNEYMEAKGNIRVFVRLRPPDNDESCITVDQNAMSLQSVARKTVDGLHDTTSTWRFSFDKIFSEDSSQQQVFDEIKLLVQSALDGFKVAIFAYGQTGSGKTYTMEGPPATHVSRKPPGTAGMIQRAFSLVFSHIQKLADTGWSYTLSASYVEIYNEAVRDLLSKDIVELKIPDNGETTMNCKVVDVVSEKQCLALLNKAAEVRATASTLTNDRSSRSHIVLQLRISATGPKNTELRGLLSLVDLAGSERIDKSQATGDRLKEAQCINKSLSALADVIQSLAEKSSHVPYRNSKLTMLLRDSLGGDSKTLMFANICPSQKNLQESLNTLRFASKVNSVGNSTTKRRRKLSDA